MNISNESDVLNLIESWKDETDFVKKRNIKVAIDTVELNAMYYELKSNDNAVERMARCKAILEKRMEQIG